MISKFFSSSSAGGSIPPGSYTPGSVLFAAADGSITEDNPRFFYDETNRRLGLGINSSLQARLHIRGTGSTNATRSFYAQNSTTEIVSFYDDRSVVFGSGSANANTNFTINAFGAAGANDYSFAIIGTSNDNILRVSNSNTTQQGGVQILRNTATNRHALSVYVGATRYTTINANGSLNFNTATALTVDDGSNYIKLTSDATTPGMFFMLDNSNSTQFTWKKGVSSTGMVNNGAVYNFITTLQEANVNGTFTFMKLRPTYNYTTSGGHVANVIGLDYNATVTSLTGAHYGFLFRTASALNGIGLGSSLPTALLHLAGSTTSRASFRIESGTLPTGANHRDGDFTYDGTDINFRQSSTTKLIEFQPISQTVNATTANTNINFNLGNVVILNLQTATTALTLSNLRVGTYIIIVKQDGTGGRLMTYGTTMNFAGGVSPVLTVTANASDIFTIVYDGVNIRTAVSQNYAI